MWPFPQPFQHRRRRLKTWAQRACRFGAMKMAGAQRTSSLRLCARCRRRWWACRCARGARMTGVRSVGHQTSQLWPVVPGGGRLCGSETGCDRGLHAVSPAGWGELARWCGYLARRRPSSAGRRRPCCAQKPGRPRREWCPGATRGRRRRPARRSPIPSRAAWASRVRSCCCVTGWSLFSRLAGGLAQSPAFVLFHRLRGGQGCRVRLARVSGHAKGRWWVCWVRGLKLRRPARVRAARTEEWARVPAMMRDRRSVAPELHAVALSTKHLH